MKDIYVTITHRVVVRTDRDYSGINRPKLEEDLEKALWVEGDEVHAEEGKTLIIEDQEVTALTVHKIRTTPAWGHPMAPWNQVSSEEREV